ncbi:hypothetical protein UAK_02641 [Enterococcus raffinosus ATCC 49464]|jgi:hypothetical protein|uniref:Uncharacterized protein n=1 Tax=Enterococcus raffinosus ATCC 49464 TaxID=1158602 RepID=R2P1F2_9ENTE|nr:hypothetical protein UAK_02641 [Enterococcus raffinosus ATCC 49464]EOT75761.1 hypothetical protein I590_02585 [Enterococcus raffinosus ATCC 49464]DAM13405.1 MAG TPA: Small acid-soluble spore protein H family [Caudoviricetes sp.]
MDMKKAKELYGKSDDKNVGLQPQPKEIENIKEEKEVKK